MRARRSRLTGCRWESQTKLCVDLGCCMFSASNYFATGCPFSGTSSFLTEWWQSQLLILKTSLFYTPLSTNSISARFDVLMAMFMKITALWVQGHAYLIQVANYMAPYSGIPQCSSIIIYNRRNQAINWMHGGGSFLRNEKQLSFSLNILPFMKTISLLWILYSFSDY